MYKHLTRDDRIALATLLREGYSQREAARSIGKDPSTVSRELRRNSKVDGSYHATHANVRALKRRKNSKKKYRIITNDTDLSSVIEVLLHPLISPEVIAHALGISHETIYNWIYQDRPDLKAQLPQRGKKRRRYGSKREKKQGWTKDVRSIDERPVTEEAWEGDTIKGATRARVLTNVERVSLFTVADLLPDGTADSVYSATVKHPFPGSMTYDRGSEFALWGMIERDTSMEIYFAHAHHPWERGKNENTNGRLRRVFPKRFDFATITQKELDEVVYLMNHIPRKSLSWCTSCEVFGRCCSSN